MATRVVALEEPNPRSPQSSLTAVIQSMRGRSPWTYLSWLVLTGLSALLIIRQMRESFPLPLAILLAWLIGISTVVWGELNHRHTKTTSWLKANLFSSTANALLSLFVCFVLLSLVRVVWDYAVVRATFDPDLTAPEARPEGVGASWGVLIGASKLLLTGTLEMEFLPRVWTAFGIVTGLGVLTLAVHWANRLGRKTLPRSWLNGLWLVSPLPIYILLAGIPRRDPFVSLPAILAGTALFIGVYFALDTLRIIQFRIRTMLLWACVWPILYLVWGFLGWTGWFTPINVDHWGGLLLTLVIAVFSIIVSFPLGVGLAFGRRSTARGIPLWLTLPIAIVLAVWALLTSTPQVLTSARNGTEKILAFWPLLIPLAAWLFQRFFKGNVISGACTIYIEIVRGVPLITVLFMAIIIVPLFFQEGAQIKNTWAVLAGFSLFNAAYLAEVVRGGLQAIPLGQYEAADALGLNSFQKIRFILLPQALQIVIPALVGLFVGVFKSSSLVGIVGLFDLMGIAASVTGNPKWQGLRTELYIIAAVVYFLGSYAMTSYSWRLERRLANAKR